MRYLFMTLILILSFTGCQDKEKLDKEAQAKHDAKIAQQARAEVLAEIEAKKREIQKQQAKQKKEKESQKISLSTKKDLQEKAEGNAKLNQMGIRVEKSTVTIDTNKTKTFFNDLGKALDIQMKKVSQDLEKGIIKNKDAGIDVANDHINIDINKTQHLLQDWGKKIQVFVQGFDDVAENLENNDTNKGQ